MSESTDVLVAYCTFPSEEKAMQVCKTLVDERLVACINVLPQVRSVFRWEGKVEDEPEVLALLKTTSQAVDALSKRIAELHPYDCPEVIAAPIVAGHAPYLSWVHDETR